MKKLITVVLAASLVLAMVVPALAFQAGGNRSTINKKDYDSFAGAEASANNRTTRFGDIELQTNSKTGWRVVADAGVKGDLTVAYKIGNAYYKVDFWFNGVANDFLIGDGSGKNGVNSVKIAFERHVCEYTSEVTKQPTCVEEGVRTYTCTLKKCSHSYTEVIDELGHDWGEWTDTNPDRCKGTAGVESRECERGCVDTRSIPTGECECEVTSIEERVTVVGTYTPDPQGPLGRFSFKVFVDGDDSGFERSESGVGNGTSWSRSYDLVVFEDINITVTIWIIERGSVSNPSTLQYSITLK